MYGHYVKKCFGFINWIKGKSSNTKLNKIIDKPTKINKDLVNKVMDVIQQQLYVTSIKLSSNLVNDLGADELNLVEIMMELEEVFNITISEDESKQCSTVESICNLIDKKLKLQR